MADATDVVVKPEDVLVTALCMWREARGEGLQGMDCVAWVVRNRCLRRGTSPEQEVMRPLQFSSMTYPHDPQLQLQPDAQDKLYAYALRRGETILRGKAGASPVGAATMYYADTIPFPASWDKSKLVLVAKIGRHRFYIEK